MIQASTATASHATVARTRAQEGDRSISSQITKANAASPSFRVSAPAASSAAASLPRRTPDRPRLLLAFRTCFSISVALAGKIAGKAKNKPADNRPEAGGNEAGNHSHRATESEPDQVLVPAGFA